MSGGDEYRCVCVLLGNPNFKDPYLIAQMGLSDYKVARVGRLTMDYKIVVKPWESGI